MKHFLFLPLLGLLGCVTTTRVTSDDTYQEINARGKTDAATISIQGDSDIVDYEGKYLNVGRDSARWINPGTGLFQYASTAALRRIRFTNRFAGALEGLALCAAPGIVGSVILTRHRSFADHNPEIADAARPVFEALLWVGILGGTAYGAAVGQRTDYFFENNPSERKTQ
jgi:hypothetical protein